MTSRFALLALVLALAAPAFAMSAHAQTPPRAAPPGARPLKPIQPPSKLPPAPRGDPRKNLDQLFAALKVAPDKESAKYIENRIWAVWASSGGDTATLLMSRIKIASEAKDLDLAIRLASAVIDIRPDCVEGWNRRATLYYLKKDYGAALSDLLAVLAREPRHFGAWAGLGIIMEGLGEDKIALIALRHALALHPHLERVPEMVKRLEITVEGRKI